MCSDLAKHGLSLRWQILNYISLVFTKLDLFYSISTICLDYLLVLLEEVVGFKKLVPCCFTLYDFLSNSKTWRWIKKMQCRNEIISKHMWNIKGRKGQSAQRDVYSHILFLISWAKIIVLNKAMVDTTFINIYVDTKHLFFLFFWGGVWCHL